MKKNYIFLMHLMMISISVIICLFVGVSMGVLFAVPCAFFLCYMELLAFETVYITFKFNLLKDENPKATRITREVYYKPLKLPAKPKRRKRK